MVFLVSFVVECYVWIMAMRRFTQFNDEHLWLAMTEAMVSDNSAEEYPEISNQELLPSSTWCMLLLI